MYGMRYRSKFILLPVDISTQHQLLKRLFFLHQMVLASLWDIIGNRCMGLSLDFSSVFLVHMSILMPAPHCFHCCSFVMSFDIGKCESSSSVILFQDCFGSSGPFAIP